VSSSVELASALEAWHDFFVASAGAAAVLLGLTFVGLTIHLERRGLDNLRRGLAIGSATNLVYAQFASLLMLTPEGVPYAQAVGLVAIGVLGVISAGAALENARRGGLSRARLGFQFGLPGVAIGLLLVAGVALSFGVEQAVWGAAAVVFSLITSGTQSAWDLLFSFAPEGREPNRQASAGVRAEDGELAPQGRERARGGRGATSAKEAG
jgi:hypothetical protein